MNVKCNTVTTPSRDREGAGSWGDRSLTVAARYKTARRRHRSAFTLVELVVVLGIISLLMVISLPNITRMMADTRRADAENRLQGLLRSARMRALHKKESGLFFYVDGGIQRIAFIEAEPLNLIPPPDEDTAPDWGEDGLSPADPGNTDDEVAEQDTADRFRVLTDTVYELPAPFRAVPRYIPFPDSSGIIIWNNFELAHDDYRDPPPEADGIENHRNFFTIIFSPDGAVEVGRPALIHDHTKLSPGDIPNNADNTVPGGITGLPVTSATKYQDTDGGFQSFETGHPLPKMVVNKDDYALTFPSVDGVLVYDDDLFRDQPDTGDPGVVTKRQFLIRQARPLYISRQTGAIVRGPLGEDAIAN